MRLEFSRATRREALTRSGMLCEASGPRYGLAEGRRCNASLGYGVEFDHDLPAEFGGDNGLANCRAICRKCHKAKTARDIRMIRKADRQRDKANGSFPPSRHGLRKPEGVEFNWKSRRYERTTT